MLNTGLIIISLSTLGLVFCALMMRRNEKVYKYVGHLNNLVHEACQRDIDEGKDWKWRYEKLEEVTYEQMVYKFWKPLDSFYPDKSFLE